MSAEISKPEAAVDGDRLPTNPTIQRWTRWLGTQRDTLGTVIAVILILLFWHFGGAYLPTYIFPTIPIAIDTTIELLGEYATYVSITETLVRILGGFFAVVDFDLHFGRVVHDYLKDPAVWG